MNLNDNNEICMEFKLLCMTHSPQVNSENYVDSDALPRDDQCLRLIEMAMGHLMELSCPQFSSYFQSLVNFELALRHMMDLLALLL